MQETLYQTADAGDTLPDSGCRRFSIRQRLQETLYQTADVASLHQTPDAGDSIRQQMQVSLYQTADARASQSDSGCRSLSESRCRRHSIRQRMH